MYPQVFTIRILSAIIPLVSSIHFKQHIDSRALRIFNNSMLVENIYCDARRGTNKNNINQFHPCKHFTLYHIYAFAAKIPPSGAGGYITDEPQFACGHVEPPKNSTIEWAALVYYSSMSCDCSYEEKILHVQAAGYKIALLMETSNCTDNIGNNNDTNVTDITIPAVLLSQTVGLSLLSYSSPTDDGEPTGSVIVEAHYGHDYTTIGIIVGVSVTFIIIMIGIAYVISKPLLKKWRSNRGLEIQGRSYTYESLAQNEHEDQSETSDDTEIEELPETELTSSQKIKQRSNMYSNASRSATHTNGGDDLEQSQLSVGDNQVDNKI